ncbi:unnamed protein product [Effrenium voratum]|nr:unnamed protein product [Effrenium voratum]
MANDLASEADVRFESEGLESPDQAVVKVGADEEEQDGAGDEEAEAEQARWQSMFHHADPGSSHGAVHAFFDFLDHISEKIRDEMESTFAHLGLLLADHACKFCLGGIIFALVCMSGLPLITFERDIYELVLEQNSPAALDHFEGQDIFKNNLSESDRAMSVLYTLPNGKNILDSPYFEEALAIHNEIKNNVTSKERKETYDQDCIRFFDNPNESCIVFCPLDLPYQVALHKGGRGFRNSTYTMMGDRARVEQNLSPEDDHGHFEFSDGFMCKYESSSNDWKFGAVLWAQERRASSTGNVRISAYSSAFATEEVFRGSLQEGHLFALAFVVVWLGCGGAMHFINFENHSWVNPTNWFTATICIVSAGLAMLSALGLCGYLTLQGLKVSTSSLFVSFLILGIAVDDMMILAGLFFEAPKDHTLAERLAASFGSAAASITLTSITALAGFLAGSAVDMVWIKSFTQVGALAVIADYIIQLTFFSGAFAAFQRGYGKLHASTKDRGHAHSALEKYARWSAHSTVCKGLTFFLFIAVIFVSLYGTQRLEASFHQKVNMPDDSHYHEYLQDGLDYMGQYGQNSVYLMMQHQVLPGPDVMRATAEYAQRIRELNGQKAYKSAATDWTVAMQLWMSIQSNAERLRVRTNATTFGVALGESLDGTLRSQFFTLATQWQGVAMAYLSSGLAVQSALAEIHGMAQDLQLGPHQALTNTSTTLREVQVALNTTRYSYGNYTQELGAGLRSALDAALVHLYAAADAYESGGSFSAAESLLQQAATAFNSSTPANTLNVTAIDHLDEVATHLLESVYAFNASVGVRLQRMAASFNFAAVSFYEALPSDDRLLGKYNVQFGQREFLRRLGDLFKYFADPYTEVVFKQWWNTTMFPMESVGIYARNTAKTLKAMQQAAETFAASDPLSPLATTCNELRVALSASPNAAFNATATKAFAVLVESAAKHAGDEVSLAHLEQHYESGALRDSGEDDKCSPQEVALESLRRGLAYGVAQYRSTAMWNAYSNFSMAEARRWLTSIVGQVTDLNTPQAVTATRRFAGHQWLSLAGERDQVSREREAERRAQRAQRAVDAARRSRLAREAAFEVWEDVDNYEESFGSEMENVVFNEDLKPGLLRASEVRRPGFPRTVTANQSWQLFQSFLSKDFQTKLLDDLEDADPTEQGTVLLNGQINSQMRRIRRASARERSFEKRMWSRSAATWEAKESFLAAFNLDDMLQERQAARDSRYGERDEDYFLSIRDYGIPDGNLPGELLGYDTKRVKSAELLSKEAGVSEEAWQRMDDQAEVQNESAQEKRTSLTGLLEAFVVGKRTTPKEDDLKVQIAELHNDDLKQSAARREELEDLRDAIRLSQIEDGLAYDFFAQSGEWLRSLGLLNNLTSMSTIYPELYMAFLGQARRHLDEMERDMSYKSGTLGDMDFNTLSTDLGYVASNLTQSIVTLLLNQSGIDTLDTAKVFMDAAVVNQAMSAYIKPDIVVEEDAGRDQQGLLRVYWTRVKVGFRAKNMWTEDGFEEDYRASLEARRLAAEWAANVQKLQERHTNYWKDISMGDPWEIGKAFSSGQVFRNLDSKQTLLGNVMTSLIYVNILMAAFCFIFLGPRLGLLLLPCIALMTLVIFGFYGICGFKIDPILALALLLSSGTTIDFILHFVMAAAACSPSNPNIHVSGSQRYIVAMKSAGVGIFASYATTMLGIIPMAFARLSAIRSLFFAYVISLNVGVFFGLVFIPLVSIYVYGVDLAPRGAKKKTEKAEEHEVHGAGARLAKKRNSVTETQQPLAEMHI